MARFPVPAEFTNDPDLAAMHEQWRRNMVLSEIEGTLSLAEVRCLPFDELLNAIENLPDVNNSGEIVYRICEYPLSENQAFTLAETVRLLADKIDRLPSKEKQRYDRAIKRMLEHLPAEAAWPVCAPWLEHKRKFRREIAYLVLRSTGVDAQAGQDLLAIFQRTGDQVPLELIARSPAATRGMDICAIMPLFEDDYWRMRLVEAVLIDDETTARGLATQYPREFTHAIGRQKDKRFLSDLQTLYRDHKDNLDYLSIYAWALGQLNGIDQLKKLREHIGSLDF